MNKLLLSITVVLGFSSCGKIQELHDAATKEIPNRMEGLANNTSELKRLETVKTAVQELNDPKNYEKLSPVPVDLMPWGKKAAENMTVEDELIPYVYIKLKDIETVRYDDNTLGKPYDMNDPACVRFEMNKVGVFNALATIAGFLPESKVDQLIYKLNNSDEYTQTIINILALRAYFINNVLMNEKYKQDKLVDLGSVEAAIGYNKSLERVLRLPYAASIGVQITGFVLLQDFNLALSVKPDMDSAKKNWMNIYDGIKTYLKVGQYSSDQGQVQNQQQRAQNAINQVLTGLSGWGVDAQNLK